MNLLFRSLLALGIVSLSSNVHAQSVSATETNIMSSRIETSTIKRVNKNTTHPKKTILAEEKQLHVKNEQKQSRTTTAIEPKKQLTVKKKDK